MRANKLKRIFSEGKAVVNGWLQIPSSFSAEVMAHQGWDSLSIDMQHGVIDYPKIENGFTVKKSVFSGKAFANVNINTENKIIGILPNSFTAINSISTR